MGWEEKREGCFSIKKKNRIQLYEDFTFRSMHFNICSSWSRRMLTFDQLMHRRARFTIRLCDSDVSSFRYLSKESGWCSTRINRGFWGESSASSSDEFYLGHRIPIDSSPLIPDTNKINLVSATLFIISFSLPDSDEKPPSDRVHATKNNSFRHKFERSRPWDYLLVIEYRYVRKEKPPVAADVIGERTKCY